MVIKSLLERSPRRVTRKLRRSVTKGPVVVPSGHNYFSHCPRDVHGHCLPSGTQKPLPKPRQPPAPEPDVQHRQPEQGQGEVTGKAPMPKGEHEAKQVCKVQDPFSDENGDGVTDFSRVGCGVLEVPPPPNQLSCLPGLTEKEQEAEKRFSDAFLKDPDEITHQYLEMVRKDKLHPEHVFSTDDAKLLSADFNPPDVDKNIVIAATNIFNAIVHTTANAIAKRAFVRYLDEVVMEKPFKDRIVMATSGGCRSGKSEVIKETVAKRMAAIWDASGELNGIENPWVFAECKKRKIKTIFVFLYADPIQTWKGLLKWSNKNGHMVDAKLFADSHTLGVKNFVAFQKRYGEGTECIIIDRTKPRPVEVKQVPPQALQLDPEQLYSQVYEILMSSEKEVSPSVMRGGIIGSRIWGLPKEQGGANEANPQV